MWNHGLLHNYKYILNFEELSTWRITWKAIISKWTANVIFYAFLETSMRKQSHIKKFRLYKPYTIYSMLPDSENPQ